MQPMMVIVMKMSLSCCHTSKILSIFFRFHLFSSFQPAIAAQLAPSTQHVKHTVDNVIVNKALVQEIAHHAYLDSMTFQRLDANVCLSTLRIVLYDTVNVFKEAL